MWPWQWPRQWSRGRPGLSPLLLPHNRHGQDPAPSRTHCWQPEPRWEPQPGGAALPQQQPLWAASLPHDTTTATARPVPGLRQGQGHLLRRPLAACPVGEQRGLLGTAVPRLLLHWRRGSAAAGPGGQPEHRGSAAQKSDNTAAGDQPEEMSRELKGIYYSQHSFSFFLNFMERSKVTIKMAGGLKGLTLCHFSNQNSFLFLSLFSSSHITGRNIRHLQSPVKDGGTNTWLTNRWGDLSVSDVRTQRVMMSPRTDQRHAWSEKTKNNI